MKNLILMVSLLMSAKALAGPVTTYSVDAVDLVNVVNQCPGGVGYRNQGVVVANIAKDETDKNAIVYTFKLILPGNFMTPPRHFGNFVITRIFTPISNPAEDAPSGRIDYKCEYKP
ncbi:hypothetical protein K2X30_11895 [bacterium]|nr:hypothetical protein [bacterium]